MQLRDSQRLSFLLRELVWQLKLPFQDSGRPLNFGSRLRVWSLGPVKLLDMHELIDHSRRRIREGAGVLTVTGRFGQIQTGTDRHAQRCQAITRTDG